MQLSFLPVACPQRIRSASQWRPFDVRPASARVTNDIPFSIRSASGWHTVQHYARGPDTVCPACRFGCDNDTGLWDRRCRGCLDCR
jgi:hypothetical protein